jgi:hypothetical protein
MTNWYKKIGPAITIINGHLATMRGNWYRVTSKCQVCGEQTVNGKCTCCGYELQCAWCGKVRQPDDTWVIVYHRKVSRTASHGICPCCYADVKAKMLIDKIHNRRVSNQPITSHV